MIHYVVFFGFAINLLGTYAYARDTLLGKTKPNRITFALWSLAPFIAVAAALVDGVTWAVVPVFAAGFCPFIVFLSSFVNKQAEWKLGPFDWVCFIFSILALVLWKITDNPNVAILFAVLADGAAALPTIIKSWKYPETETAISYLAGGISVATSFFALKAFSFAELAFPLYAVVVCALIAFLVYNGQRKLAAQELMRDAA